MEIQENVPLREYTTLKTGGPALFLIHANTDEDVRRASSFAREKKLPLVILGEGSNVLVPDEGIHGVVLRIHAKNVTYSEEGTYVYVSVDAGAALDELVDETTLRGLWGLENLSGIPGTVGAAPIQNVGAYGVEMNDVVISVRVMDPVTGVVSDMSAEECQFQYRDSYFKHEGKNLIILSVTFRLSTVAAPKMEYGELRRFAEGKTPELRLIRNEILRIRGGKFPDWHIIGTAGSFFKNPIVTSLEGNRLMAQYPTLPTYPLPDGRFKIPLGWILDRVLGLRGFCESGICLYKDQALVLTHDGSRTSHDILEFSKRIIQKVFDATGIVVEREVTLLHS